MTTPMHSSQIAKHHLLGMILLAIKQGMILLAIKQGMILLVPKYASTLVCKLLSLDYSWMSAATSLASSSTLRLFPVSTASAS